MTPLSVGQVLTSGETYDAPTYTWTETTNSSPVVAPDKQPPPPPYGRILIVGGRQGGREIASVLFLDPA